MNQYLISALDFTDQGAFDRRMNARPLHLKTMRLLKETNNFILGGMVLNDEDKILGSTLVMQFEREQELSAWLAEEPYLLHKVWEKVDIKPFKVAQV